MPALKFNVITKAVAAQLAANLSIQVERGNYVNADPSVAVNGWVGVYRGKLAYEPAAVSGRQFNVSGPVVVIVQSASADDGEDAEDLLEDYVGDVIDALEVDKTFGGTISLLVGYSIEYSYSEEDSGSLHMQWATISVQFEKRISL